MKMDFNQTFGEKARWELHKDTVCCFEQILEESPHKTVTVQSLISLLTNCPSNKNKTYFALLEKQGQIHKQCSHMNSYT